MIKVAKLIRKRSRIKRVPGKSLLCIKALRKKEIPKASVEIAGKESVIKY